MKNKIWFAIIAILILIVALLFINKSISNKTPSTPAIPPQSNASLESLQTGPAPWPVELDHLQQRLNAINLPALPAESFALHAHQHLDIYIQGNHLTIPAGIGINEKQEFISPIHTHDTSGIIHIESPIVQPFSLGEFFDIWGVLLSNDCLGGYCNNSTEKLRLFVNGKVIDSNFTDVALKPHQEIVMTYGTEKQQPASVSASFNFPPGD